MDKQDYWISSVSINEDFGSAKITIEGRIPSHIGCDDPIVELFRPIRANYAKEIFFSIHTHSKMESDSIVCTLYPSNKRNRTTDEFLSIAAAALKGDSSSNGILSDYQNILEKYFSDEDGLSTYLKLVEEAESASEFDKPMIYHRCNESIKAFVAKMGLVMPSIREYLETLKKPAYS